MELAPILLFTYNRLWHTKQTVDSLLKNELARDSNLYIYSDASKNKKNEAKCIELRAYLKTISGFKSINIIERTKNMGLAKSIISCSYRNASRVDSVIVLEDDMVSSPYFLNYMNEGLKLYANNEGVACIHAYRYPIGEVKAPFFVKGADCWVGELGKGLGMTLIKMLRS